MTPSEILHPLFAQVLLTFLVWAWLLYGRVSTLLRNGTNPQKTADDDKAKVIFQRYTNQSDNLENLFELPVLFYIAVLLVAFTGKSDLFYLCAAWAFVLTRAIHSLIHCTYNRVVHRFYAYVISSSILWVMWIRIAGQNLGF